MLRRLEIYLHERVMPRPEPSADRWDWPIGTLRGQRSRTRGLDNLTGMDWSLPGRHRLEKKRKEKKKRMRTFSHPRNHKNQTNKRQRQSIHTVHAVTFLCVCF